ncbi:MAG: alpha/beta hydrolase, partial [Proteobacteria bacterium]|nr:alpha/beta hydrolase [Pseudomonadota bacterium]
SRRYDTTSERAIIGESLAGLFVVETLLLSPGMFDTYIAVDPSVWWNRYALTESAPVLLKENNARNKALFIAAGREAAAAPRFGEFVATLREQQQRLRFTYVPMPGETHATLYHPAAMKAFRTLFPARKEN